MADHYDIEKDVPLRTLFNYNPRDYVDLCGIIFDHPKCKEILAHLCQVNGHKWKHSFEKPDTFFSFLIAGNTYIYYTILV